MNNLKIVGLTLISFSLCACMSESNKVETSDPIFLGDITSYAGLEKYTLPYKNGYELALNEINEQGGIAGRQIIVVSRDDQTKNDVALQIAHELTEKYKIKAIFGTAMFGIANGLSEFAEEENIVFVASLPMDDSLLTQQSVNYSYRLRPSSRMQASMLANEASKLKVEKWAIIAPNYAFGWDAVAAFKETLSTLNPDVEFVEEIYPERFGFKAEEVISKIKASDADGMFNATFAADLQTFMDKGFEAGVFEGKSIVSMLGGEPEYAENINREALTQPWLVSGYPSKTYRTSVHDAFFNRYEAEYGSAPGVSALIGYMTMQSIIAAMNYEIAHEDVAFNEAFTRITIDTPVGPIKFRESDHQSTMGTWIGWLGQTESGAEMSNYEYKNGAEFMPVYKTP